MIDRKQAAEIVRGLNTQAKQTKEKEFKQALKQKLEEEVTKGDKKKKEWFRKHVIVC